MLKRYEKLMNKYEKNIYFLFILFFFPLCAYQLFEKGAKVSEQNILRASDRFPKHAL